MAGMAVTYRYPAVVAGGAVAPTAAQILKLNTVQADIACGAGATDDATDIVHNFNLPVADGTNGTPRIAWHFVAQGTAAKAPTITFKDKDTITVTAAAKGANCDFTMRVQIDRPWTENQ